MPPPPGAVSGFPLKLALEPGDFAVAAVVMLVVMAVSALPPVARAMRLRIVDALGHV
jgi:ABC-type lipoprotein release transport system permease subunit